MLIAKLHNIIWISLIIENYLIIISNPWIIIPIKNENKRATHE